MKEPKETDIGDLQPIQAAGLDLEEFEGEKKSIEKVEVREVKSNFAESGLTKALCVMTEEVTTVTNREGDVIPILASELFNLKQNEDGVWGYSTSPKSKLQKFMKKLGIKAPKEMVGKKVVLRVRKIERPDGTTGEFLGFITA